MDERAEGVNDQLGGDQGRECEGGFHAVTSDVIPKRRVLRVRTRDSTPPILCQEKSLLNPNVPSSKHVLSGNRYLT